MNSACPTPELVFSSLDSVICLPLLQETCFFYYYYFVTLSLPFFLSQALGLFLIDMIVLSANGKKSHVVLVIFLTCSKK